MNSSRKSLQVSMTPLLWVLSCSIILRMNRQVKEWGSWNRLKSFLQQREIKDGIDRLNRDLNAAMRKYSVRREPTNCMMETNID